MAPAWAAEQFKLDTPELRVIYDAGLEAAARQALSDYAAIQQELETLFQWSLDFQPTLVLISDKKRFQRLAGHELVVAYALPRKNAVVIDHTQMNTSPFTLRSTFKHELCHLLLHHYIQEDRLPRWLDEGVCQWASDGLADIIMDTKRDVLLAAILSDSYFDLERLQHRFPQDKNALMLAYAQSKNVVEYLSRAYGPRGIQDFLRLLQQGYDFKSAFRLRFAVAFDTFQLQWRDDLKKNINWFTYLSMHLYEILFLTAALLTILGFVRKIMRRRSYSDPEEQADLD